MFIFGIFRAPHEVDRFLQILSPLSRALYLYHCFNEALARARARQPDVLLINSYWYKYYATEVAHGADPDQILDIADRVFAEPDVTFYLRVDPRDAYARKAMLSGYWPLYRYHPGLALAYVLPTFLDRRVKKSEEILEQLRQRYGPEVCDPVRYNVRLSEAPGYFQTIFEYAPGSSGAQDYQKLVEKILQT